MLLRHSISYLVARGVPGLINFAALALYTRLLAPEEFGRYALVLAGVGMADVCLFQWLRLVLGRYLPAHREEPGRFLGGALSLLLLPALLVTTLGTLLALLWPDPVWRRLLAMAVPMLLAHAWFEFNLAIRRAQLAPGRYGSMLASQATLAILFGGGLAWAGLGAVAPLLGLFAGNSLVALTLGAGAWRGVRPRWPEAGELRRQLSYGLPLTITFLLGWVVSSSDRLMIAWLRDEASAGVYSAGYDLAQQSIGLLLAIVNTAAYPLAVHALEARGAAEAQRQVANNGALVVVIAFAAASGLAALSPEIVALFMGPEFHAGALAIVPWVAAAAAVAGIKSFHFDIAFHLAERSRGLVLTSTVAASANVGLNLLLIPRFGIVGAAWATLAAFGFAAGSSAWLGRRAFPMPAFPPVLARGLVVGLATGVGARLAAGIAHGPAALALGVPAGVLCAVGSSLALDVGGLRVGLRGILDRRRRSSGARLAGQRVGIYVPSLRGGGAERVMATLANGFAARGLPVDLVLARAEGPYLRDLSDAVRVVDLGARRVVTSLPGLVRYLRRERPRALLSALSHANVVALAAARVARTPTRIVVSERNHSLSNAKTLRGRSMGMFMRWTYPAASGVVAVSAGVADDLARILKLSRERIAVIYNPVVDDRLLSMRDEPLQHPWGAPGEPPFVLGVGRLTDQKDFPTLIRAFARLRGGRAGDPPRRLVILGEGERRAELEALVGRLGLAEHVALPGFVENPFAWMRRAALFVLSSATEGLPNALIQAMACGTPVVSTDCPSGPAEILEEGRWGRLVPVGDVEALAAAMTATLGEREHPDVERRAGEFGVDEAVRGYLEVLGIRGGVREAEALEAHA